jgi:hypothetical protein
MKNKEDIMRIVRSGWFYGLMDMAKREKDLKKTHPALFGYIQSAKFIVKDKYNKSEF